MAGLLDLLSQSSQPGSPDTLVLPPDPNAWLKQLAGLGFHALAPHLASLAAGEPPPPLQNLPDTPRKVPPTDDPRIAGAMGEAANIGMSLLPFGGTEAAGAAAIGRFIPGLLRRAAPKLEAELEAVLASRSPRIYNPPEKPLRPFEADYPQGASTDAAG